MFPTCATTVDPFTKDAEQRLRRAIPDPAVRWYLLKNLDRTAEGPYRWKVNLDAIRRSYAAISGTVAVRRFFHPCLFIRGGRSDYVPDEDWPEVKAIFPRAELATLPHAGHWVHVDDKTGFLETVKGFMARA
jgi:pimeloyl-ACP methyl ester carboxylesterase